MNILYFGDDSLSSTSYHRAGALVRLGHEVLIYNPKVSLKKNFENRYFSAFHYHTGYIFTQHKLLKWVKSIIENLKAIDLVWIDSGELFGPQLIQQLKLLNCKIVLYNHDDPTGIRDGNRFYLLQKAIPYYDLCVVVREENVNEFKNLGAQKVLKVFRSYDEIMHKPFNSLSDIPDIFKSEVAFIGTWMRHEKRDVFLLHLINSGVPISIWGSRWKKSPYWKKLEPNYRGSNLGGRDYVAAIQGAKICLGFLSKGNRDLHTTRTMEIPYAGGLFCAERTTEHLELYKEGEEAVFWNDAEECAQVCMKLLNDDVLRNNIKQAGMERVRLLKLGHEDICNNILNELENI